APTVLVLDDAFTRQASEEIRDAVAAAAAHLRAAGFTVRRAALFDEIEPLNETHNRMVAREFADVHRAWVELHRDRYSDRSLALIEKGLTVSDAELEEARAGRLELRARFERLLESEHAELILSPSAAGAAPAGIDATGSPLLNLPFTYAGLPTMTLPVATNAAGLPLGLQVAARFGADEELVAHAASIETVVSFGVART
ncbi:MAG: amidase family protein, partial [Spirochaetota bacterium]